MRYTKTILILTTVLLSIALKPPIAAAQSPLNPTLDAKYLEPAGITKLDWLLLKAELETLSKVSRWDGYGLIQSMTVYHAHPSRGLVGITFVLNKEVYIRLSDDVTRKTFADAVVQACDLLSNTIPEVAGGANTYANFVPMGGGGVVAEFVGGKVTLTK